MASKGKIVREEFFPYLVENGFDDTGMVIWVDFGKYFKVMLKSEYENRDSLDSVHIAKRDSFIAYIMAQEIERRNVDA